MCLWFCFLCLIFRERRVLAANIIPSRSWHCLLTKLLKWYITVCDESTDIYGTVDTLWTTLLNIHASCLAFVYMRSVRISNEVHVCVLRGRSSFLLVIKCMELSIVLQIVTGRLSVLEMPLSSRKDESIWKRNILDNNANDLIDHDFPLIISPGTTTH
jgi:hypothetical protein